MTIHAQMLAKRRQLDQRVGERRSLLDRQREVDEELADLAEQEVSAQEAATVLASYGDLRTQSLMERLEGVVTHGLDAVFGAGELTFRITQDRRGSSPTAILSVVSMIDGEQVETSVMDSRGGGVAAVIGALLRVVVLLWRKGAVHTLFLDETFAQLSEGYEQPMAEFLRKLVDMTDIQIVMITHSHGFDDVADVHYHFTHDGSKTLVQRVDVQ